MSQRRAIRGGLTVSATLLFAPLCLAQSPEPRPWSLSLRTFVVHDSNVPLAATDTTFAGSSASNVVGLALAGDYRFYRDAKWTVGATGALQQTYNGEASLKDFNLTSVSPGLVARYAFRLSGRPARLSMSYAVRRDWLGGSGFSTGHAATVDVGVRPSSSTDAGAFVSVGNNKFDEQGPEPAASSRDAVSYRAGLRGMVGFNGNRQAIQATLAYVKNDAKGANFSFAGPSGGLQFISYLVGPWAIAASANYSSADYTTFAVVPRRENRATDYRLTLYGPLARNLSADFSIGRSYYHSNQLAFEAKRQNVSLGLSYSF